MKLWTKDFTIITLGSVVSMLGNALTGFAMSLLVLDYTGKASYYAIYLACWMLPQFIMPIFSGAFLDRFSRKKTIYTLDFLTAALYVGFAFILKSGWFNFPVFAISCMVIGAIDSVYMVAYDSLYPMLITEGNYQKAYSIASVLETCWFVMMPVATFVYKSMGIAPLFLVNAAFLFVAAVMETQISHEEKYVDEQMERLKESGEEIGHVALMFRDIKEGFQYLKAEKALLFVTLYFAVNAFAYSANEVVDLPFFRETFNNGEYLYSAVVGCGVIARAIGGLIHYKFKIPAAPRFTIAFCVYCALAFINAIYLFLPIPVMMAFCAMDGILGVTSYTIRISATQSYVPDEKKGRFNGAFNMLNAACGFVGTLLSGALTEVFRDVRFVLVIFMAVCLVAAIVFIGGNKKYIAPLYNRQE